MSTMENFIKPSRGNSSSELEMTPTSVPGILRRVGDAKLQEAQFLSIPRETSHFTRTLRSPRLSGPGWAVGLWPPCWCSLRTNRQRWPRPSGGP